MFISSSSVQSSLWGWTNKELPSTTGLIAGNLNSGNFSGFTLARNGYSYAVPSNTSNNSVLVIEPGTGNNGLTNYTVATCAAVAADGSGTKPNFNTQTNAAFQTKGILAQDGKIYYIPTINNVSGTYAICVLTPNNGTDCTWTFYNISELGVGGGILGSDGYIYIIPGSNSPSLYRLDISGGTPTIDYSFYDGTGSVTAYDKIVQPGTSGTSVVVNNVSNLTIGMRVMMLNNNDTSGLLSDENDTVIEDIIGNTVILNLAPINPIAANGTNRIWFCEFSKSLVNTNTRRRWANFLNKSYAGTGDNSTNGDNAVFDLERHPNHGIVATSFSVQGFSGAFVAPGSVKIYLAPGVNNQLFIINPDEWSSKGAITSMPGLQLKTVGIRTGKSTSPNYTAKKTNSFKKFSGFIIGADGNAYFSIFYSDNFVPSPISPTTTFGVDATYRKTFKLDLNTNTISEVGDSSTITDVTAPGLFPNGEIVQIKHTGSGTTNTYKRNIVINTEDSSNIKFALNSTSFIPMNTYTQTISNTGWSNGTFFPQTGFITFNTNDALGKVILPLKGAISKYGIEFLSVKGFYTGVTNFNKMDDSKLFIPSNLADLPTSDYNVYKNTLV